MKTKWLFSFMLAFFMLGTTLQASAAGQGVTVQLDGVKKNFTPSAMIVEGRTLVPLRGIFEALGAKVDWDNNTRTVVAKKGENTFVLQVGSKIGYKNGGVIRLDVPAQIIQNRTLVPLRVVSEALGTRVDWNAATRTVLIQTLSPIEQDKQAITRLLTEQIEALNEENAERYMQTLTIIPYDPFTSTTPYNTLYEDTEAALGMAFSMSNLHYTLESHTIESLQGNEATVRVIFTTIEPGNTKFQDNRTEMVNHVKKVEGNWKMERSEVVKTENLPPQ